MATWDGGGRVRVVVVGIVFYGNDSSGCVGAEDGKKYVVVVLSVVVVIMMGGDNDDNKVNSNDDNCGDVMMITRAIMKIIKVTN